MTEIRWLKYADGAHRLQYRNYAPVLDLFGRACSPRSYEWTEWMDVPIVEDVAIDEMKSKTVKSSVFKTIKRDIRGEYLKCRERILKVLS